MCEASASHDVSYNYSTRYDSQPKRKNKPSNELSVCSGLLGSFLGSASVCKPNYDPTTRGADWLCLERTSQIH